MGGHSHHGHQHAHGHAHGSSHDQHRSFNKSFAIATTLAIGYAIIEIIYGLSADSMSLVADAIHNLGDGLGLILAWVANWLLSFPARKRYSYGFKRTTIIAALINAFVLITTSVLIAYESFYKLMHMSDVNEHIVIVIGLIGIVVNGGSSLLFMRGATSDLNIKGAYLHLLADALILVGVVISAIIIAFTGWNWIDPVVSLIIVGIIIWGTWSLLRDSLSLILDAVPHYIDHIGVKEYLSQYPNVTAIHDLHIWGLSTREVALTVHLIMPNEKLSDADYKKINDHLQHDFHISHVTIQVESGSADDACLRSEKC